MVDSLATVALETLRDLLVDEAKLLSSVGGQVEEFEEQLQTMHSFLKDVDKREDRYNSAVVRDWVAKLRRLSVRAETVLERYAIEVSSKRDETKTLKDKLKRYACILGECVSVHQTGTEIQDIMSRMADLTDNLKSIPKAESSSSALVDDARMTYGLKVEEHFVGMEEDIELLKSLVTSDERSNQVISIWGMGGLGKTTLATKIYNLDAVKRVFEARAWICVSQKFQRKGIFEQILKQLLPKEKKDEITEMDEGELVRELYNVQTEKRCLVVLDDIWEVDHWNSLKCIFPIGEERCKVMLTSRNEKIAATEYVHKLKFLTEDEGWKLLQKIALPINNLQELSRNELKLFEENGREIVRKCGCLPLPISVIGGTLRQEKSWSQWKKVCKNIVLNLQRGEGVELNKKVAKVLDLSYNVLPYNLKSCFLYLGCFPEDTEIEAEDLYSLWMSEGMISSEDRGRGETLRDVAERYLSELASRCMVQVKMLLHNSFESCRLHDLVRDLCLSKGKDEGIIEVADTTSQMKCHDASSISRLAVHVNIKTDDYQLPKCKNLRSLLFLKDLDESRDWNTNLASINFGMYKSLKILILKGFKFRDGHLPEGIEKLILLKHLSIEGCEAIGLMETIEMPKSIGKLPCLQSLDLRAYSDISLSNWIHKMRRLKHLYLGHMEIGVIEGGKLQLDGLNELEKLIGFDSWTCNTFDLVKLPKLQEFEGRFEDDESFSIIVDHILNHQEQFHRTSLSIQQTYRMYSEAEVVDSNLLRKTLMCHSLSRLKIHYRLDKLISYEPHFGRNLVSLSLHECCIEDIEMLEKLPMLQRLVLKDDSFVGREMVCRANGFPQLRSLEFYTLLCLEVWKVEKKAMVNLSSLVISDCRRLKMLPEGLKFIATLKELRFKNMFAHLLNRARVVDGKPGEDYHKIKHIPSVYLSQY